MTKNHVAMPGQRGFVLISSLILLMMLTLIGAAMVNLGTINLRIINNTQRQMEARSVAQRVIDGIISANFTKDLDTLKAVFTGSPYTVALADAPYKTYQVGIMERPCMQQFQPFKENDPRTAIDPVTNKCVGPYCLCKQGASTLCADTLWRIRAQVSEGWFGANEGVVQGVSLVLDVENGVYHDAEEYAGTPSSTDEKNPYCH